MGSKRTWERKLPNENEIVCEKNFNEFFDIMLERMLIWKRRFIDEQNRPWSNNNILNKFKFTNVYRMLDRSSQWQIQHILLDKDVKGVNLVWKLVVYRMFNNPETFEKGLRFWKNGIPDYKEYDVNEWYKFIQGIKKSGDNPFTNAYLTNTLSYPGLTRVESYTKKILPIFHKRIPKLYELMLKAKKPEEIIDFLTLLPSCGMFMAYEYYQDFTYIAIFRDDNFFKFTQDDYTNVGPGASLGIRLIFPELKKEKQKQGIYWLKEFAGEELEKARVRLGVNSVPYVQWNKKKGEFEIIDKCNISLHQIEMWLCEYQKYWKMCISEGKQRSVFKPKTNVKVKCIQTELLL